MHSLVLIHTVSASSTMFPRHLRCSKGWYELVNEIPGTKTSSSNNSIDGDFHDTHTSSLVAFSNESSPSQFPLTPSSFEPVSGSRYAHGDNYIPAHEPWSVNHPSLDSQSGNPIHKHPSLPNEYSISGHNHFTMEGSAFQERKMSPSIQQASWSVNAVMGIPSRMEHGPSPHDQYIPNFDQGRNRAPQATASLEHGVSIPVSIAIPEYNSFGGPLGPFQPIPGSNQPTSRETLAGALSECDSFLPVSGAPPNTYYQDYDETLESCFNPPHGSFVANATRYILFYCNCYIISYFLTGAAPQASRIPRRGKQDLSDLSGPETANQLLSLGMPIICQARVLLGTFDRKHSRKTVSIVLFLIYRNFPKTSFKQSGSA